MQVFIINSPYFTACHLDPKRLNLTRHPEELIDILIDCLNGDITDFADADKIIKQLTATGDPYIIRTIDEIVRVI